MRTIFSRLALALLVLVATVSTAGAQTQTATFSVSAINQIAFVGTPTLAITTAVAGSAPTSVTDATSTWSVTTNQTGAKISASIATAMPTGVTLSVALTAPTGGTSTGSKALSLSPVDLVTGVTTLAQASMGLTYKLDATVLAGVVTSQTRVVTYTITGGT